MGKTEVLLDLVLGPAVFGAGQDTEAASRFHGGSWPDRPVGFKVPKLELQLSYLTAC